MLSLADATKKPGVYRFVRKESGELLDTISVLVVTRKEVWYSHVQTPTHKQSIHSLKNVSSSGWGAYLFKPEGRSLRVFAPSEARGNLLLLADKPCQN